MIAGYDNGLDMRQNAVQFSSLKLDYLSEIEKGVKGMKIGILKEGFGHQNSQPEVDEKVMKAIKVFEKLGAQVYQVSVPWHNEVASTLWKAIGFEGGNRQMMEVASL